MGYKERRELYAKIAEHRGSSVLAYVTSTRPNVDAQIQADVVDVVVRHLDEIGDVPKLSLVLHTNGGDLSTSAYLIKLLHLFCKELEIIVPRAARSGGSLMCLGAKTLVMTKQAALGPIDPTVTTPFSPSAANGRPLGVNVEFVTSFLKHAVGESTSEEVAFDAMKVLSSQLHPLAFGACMRVHAQIRMLCGDLLTKGGVESERHEALTKFLCSESGSHDYTINRNEAADLGLPVEKPTAEFYEVLRAWYADVSDQLRIQVPLDVQGQASVLQPNQEWSEEVVGGLVESLEGGSDVLNFRYFGRMLPAPQGFALQTGRQSKGWTHE